MCHHKITNIFDGTRPNVHRAVLTPWEFLSEALFPSGSEEKLMFFFFSSRKIIYFYEVDMEAWTRLLSTGSLSLGFERSRKWIAVNEVCEWDMPVQGPFSGHQMGVFL